MAINWINVNSITRERFIPTIADQIYTAIPLWNYLNTRGRIVLDGGRDIREPVLMGKLPGGAFSLYDTLSATPTEVVKHLTLDYKLYHTGVPVDDHSVMLNGGESKVLDLIALYMEDLRLSMQDRLATALFAASPGPKELDSLQVAISATGTYAGINRATDTWWAATETAMGGAEPTFSLMQREYGKVTFGESSPDIIVTTQLIFNKLWANALTHQRYPEGDSVLVGWPHIRFNKARIVVDSKCPSGQMYMLNTDFIKLVVHRDWDFRFSGWKEVDNQAARIGYLFWGGNLVVNAPRFHAKLTGFSEA